MPEQHPGCEKWQQRAWLLIEGASVHEGPGEGRWERGLGE